MRPSFGQYPPASHVILHLSDTHLLAADGRLGGTIDVTANLERTLARIRRLDPRPDAIVFTGDLTDLGEPDAYRRLRELVEPVAAELDAPIIWVAGNHDERAPMRSALLGEAASDAPITGVWDLSGLRVIALDTSVPGWHHGELGAEQLAWLADQLAAPAPHGTILALHHPPLPSSLPLFDILELRDQPELAEVIAGTDVRAVLAGHLHASMSGTFGGVPVSVAAATCYTMDLGLAPQAANGMDAGQSFNLVHVYENTITHSVVPVDYVDGASTFTPEWYATMAALTPEERLDRFSRKPVSGADAG